MLAVFIKKTRATSAHTCLSAAPAAFGGSCIEVRAWFREILKHVPSFRHMLK